MTETGASARAPAQAPAPARAAWPAAAALALAAAALHALAHRGEILHGLSDESLLVPLARKAWDGALYAGDTWLTLAGRVFGRVYSLLLGGVLHVVDDPVAAGRVLAVPFQAVFLAGCFRIVERAAGCAAAWGGMVGLAVLPALLAACVSGDVAWPLAAGASLPRDLVFALLPWLWSARQSALAGDRLLRRIGVGFVTGLLANLHPLTALHAIALFGVLDILQRPTLRGLRDAVLIGFVSVHGAVPYLIQWGSFPSTPGAAPPEVVLWRIEGIGAWTLPLWVRQIEIAAWFTAACVVLGRRRADARSRVLRVAAVVSLVLCAAAPAFHVIVAGIQFDRMSRYAVWLAVLAIAADLPAAWRVRDRAALVLCGGCLLAGVGGRAAVRALTGAERGPVEWIARVAERRLHLDAPALPTGALRGAPAAVVPHPVPDRPRAGEPSADPARSAAFRDVCAWVRGNTPPQALILVPPEDFGAFRAYAVRPVNVTRKEGGFALSFLGGRGNDWFTEYRNAVLAHADGGDALAGEAAAHRARWAVRDAPGEPPRGWTEVHAAPPYRVFRTAVP